MNAATSQGTPRLGTPRFFLRGVQAITVLGLMLGLLGYIDFILHPIAPDAIYHLVLTRPVYYLIFCPLILSVGVLIIRRMPDNVIGYLVILWGLLNAVPIRADGDLLSLSMTQLYEASVAWNALFCMLALFPTGEPYPRRAGRWYLGLVTVMFVLGILLVLSQAELAPGYSNPLYIAVLGPLQAIIQSTIGLPIIPIVIFPLISLGLRFRSVGSHERRQLKWLALSSVIMIGLVVSTFVIPGLLGKPLNNDSPVKNLMFSAVILFPPLTIGYAILRHRLYDIDIIIRRTLIYSVLTAILAVIYFGGVMLAQAALRPIIGENSDAGIVISTLVIAALFTPLRRRVQNVIDRRFYRRKYDAERTLAAFNATMRDEVDLDKLQAALVNVVQETMQPKVVTLWVKEKRS